MLAFAHLTDLHLRPPGVLTLGRIDADRFATQAIDAVIARHRDLAGVIVSGDICDLGEDDAYQRAVMLLSRFEVPVFVVPGNHDRTERLHDAFITFPGVAERPVANKVCHSAIVEGVRLVMLDTSVDGLDTGEHFGRLGAAQLAWLDDVLGDGVPALLAMHHPPFSCGIGFMDGIPLEDADAFAEVVARHANVRRIVCGHVHRTIVSDVAGVPAMAIPGVAHQVELALSAEARPRLVMEPPAYGLHLFEGDKVISHVGYSDDYGPAELFSALKDEAEPAR